MTQVNHGSSVLNFVYKNANTWYQWLEIMQIFCTRRLTAAQNHFLFVISCFILFCLFCRSFKSTSSFTSFHILSFVKEFIIALFTLAVFQEKQLSVKRLFSPDRIYLLCPEQNRTVLIVGSVPCTQPKGLLSLRRYVNSS